MNIYDRQNRLDPQPKIPEHVAVVGLGGTGFYTAYYLAMVGVKTLTLIDPDIIEDVNLNRLPFTGEDIGKRKVKVIADYLMELRPSLIAVAYPNRFERLVSDLEVISPHLVCDCTDNVPTQNTIYRFCVKQRIPYLGINYDGYRVSVVYEPDPKARTFWESEEDQGYRIVPSYVVPPALASAIGVNHILTNPDKPLHIHLDLSKVFGVR